MYFPSNFGWTKCFLSKFLAEGNFYNMARNKNANMHFELLSTQLWLARQAARQRIIILGTTNIWKKLAFPLKFPLHPFPAQFGVNLQESLHARIQLLLLKAASVLVPAHNSCIERMCFLVQDRETAPYRMTWRVFCHQTPQTNKNHKDNAQLRHR